MLQLLLSGQLAAATIVTAATYALVGIGLNLVYGTMRLINVAHGDLAMLGGYGAYLLFTSFGMSPLLALFITAAGAAIFAVVGYYGLFRQMLGSRGGVAQLESNSLLVFFGLSIIIENTVAVSFTATPRGYQYLTDVYTFGNVSITGNGIAAALVALAAVLGIFLFLRFNIFGLAIRALIEHRDAATVVGVDIDRVQLVSLMTGFATAAIAGTLISMMQTINPFTGFPLTIAAFVVVIMGGLGRIGGGIVAAGILAVIETYGVALTSSTFRSVLLYGVFVAILILRPQGLFNRGGLAR